MSEELAPLTKRTIAVRNKAQAIQRLTTSLEEIVTIRQDWITERREELARAIEANKALGELGASDTRKRYSRNRVAMLRKMVNILEAGFIPIPRFSADTLNIEIDQLPVKSLMAMSDAKATELFDEIRIVKGREQERGAWQKARVTQRDPLLVGIIRMPEAIVETPAGPGYVNRRRLPAREHHFLLAWWSESDERDEDMW